MRFSAKEKKENERGPFLVFVAVVFLRQVDFDYDQPSQQQTRLSSVDRRLWAGSLHDKALVL